MDAQRIAIAEKCLAGAHEKTLSFPEIVAVLIGAGFDGYAVDYRRDVTTYYLPDGAAHVVENRSPCEPIAAAFDQPGIAAQIKWAQANPPDYSYAAFCRNLRALGCAGYLVSFPGRRVLYFGRTAEIHVEHFPQ